MCDVNRLWRNVDARIHFVQSIGASSVPAFLLKLSPRLFRLTCDPLFTFAALTLFLSAGPLAICSICDEFEEMSMHAGERPKETAEVVALQNYLNECKEKRIVKLKNEIKAAAERVVFLLYHATLDGNDLYMQFPLSLAPRDGVRLECAYSLFFFLMFEEFMLRDDKLRKFNRNRSHDTRSLQTIQRCASWPPPSNKLHQIQFIFNCFSLCILLISLAAVVVLCSVVLLFFTLPKSRSASAPSTCLRTRSYIVVLEAEMVIINFHFVECQSNFCARIAG